jgi:hypothetical protein
MIKYKNKIFKDVEELYKHAITIADTQYIPVNFETFLSNLGIKMPVHEAILGEKKKEKTQEQSEPQENDKIISKKKTRAGLEVVFNGKVYESKMALYKAISQGVEKHCSYFTFIDNFFRKKQPIEQALLIKRKKNVQLKPKINKKHHEVYVNGKPLSLTSKEFKREFGVSLWIYTDRIAKGMSHEEAICKKYKKCFKVEGLGEFQSIKDFKVYLEKKGINVSDLTARRMASGIITNKMKKRLFEPKKIKFKYEGVNHEFHSIYEAVKKTNLSGFIIKKIIEGKAIKRDLK